jgi:hypothetical protein
MLVGMLCASGSGSASDQQNLTFRSFGHFVHHTAQQIFQDPGFAV